MPSSLMCVGGNRYAMLARGNGVFSLLSSLLGRAVVAQVCKLEGLCLSSLIRSSSALKNVTYCEVLCVCMCVCRAGTSKICLVWLNNYS